METYNHTYRCHNFSHKDLSALTFTACTFIRYDFRRADLRDTTFVNCKFIEQGDIEGCKRLLAGQALLTHPFRRGRLGWGLVLRRYCPEMS